MAVTKADRSYNANYSGAHLNRVAFPLGGIGAGMICLEGTGAISHVSLRNEPGIFNEPPIFAALCVKGKPAISRVLEGPVPEWKIFGAPNTGNGAPGKHYGLPRCTYAEFHPRFPFGLVRLKDNRLPVEIEITGWSPFIPGDADNSSLPLAGLEYRIINKSKDPIEAIFSFHALNFMARLSGSVKTTSGGFILSDRGTEERPWDKGAFSIATDDPEAKINTAWFRGGWFDPLSMVWKAIEEGKMPQAGPITEGNPSPGGSLHVPVKLDPDREKTVHLHLSWYVPKTELRMGEDPGEISPEKVGCSCNSSTNSDTHVPWYAGRFDTIDAVNSYWGSNYSDLRDKSIVFSDCFYDTTLPPEVIEAIAANLTILKSPTILRQKDGRLWCWEGCCDGEGCCHGSCTHVWNYAQALAHLFPDLEQSLRETEFHECQDEKGHQNFRASLPIRPTIHSFHAAADGQLGGIMKAYREWRISGDTGWLRGIWPRIRQSLVFCIDTWDPDHEGILREPHHNTYDIEFWGPDGMCTSFYLGALRAAIEMANAIGDNASLYEKLLTKGIAYMEKELFNGEYFIQQVQWSGLHAPNPAEKQVEQWNINYSPEAHALLKKEGPKYQYGTGCLSDGVLGTWIAEMCGVPPFLNDEKVRDHLLSVYKYNFLKDLSEHPNPQRPTYALGDEAGLLLCSWPNGGALSLPFVYSNEVWTGIEYQVAGHLILKGHTREGLEIVRAARDRYDGRIRNPFNEYECGHWYARALSSYGLLQALTGVRYDGLEKTMKIAPNIEGDFKTFFSTATGFATVGVNNGKPFIEVKHGVIDVKHIDFQPWESKKILADYQK